ncbi:MAG: helix-turn-helix transcriptional regulator, partial [Actinobacteria bacterium]|nr:helix-turn-helix transcriptional regulator [Actinomycetota bacterium]
MNLLPTLKALREQQQLSQRALAEKSGVAHDTIGQLERGERKARPSTIRKLADALNVCPVILTSSPEHLLSLT